MVWNDKQEGWTVVANLKRTGLHHQTHMTTCALVLIQERMLLFFLRQPRQYGVYDAAGPDLFRFSHLLPYCLLTYFAIYTYRESEEAFVGLPNVEADLVYLWTGYIYGW